MSGAGPALAALLLAGGCALHDPDEPGRLVRPTVDDDPSLPALEVNGTRLHVEIVGPAGAPVIVLLHGGRWGVAAELRWTVTALTRLQHTRWYRAHVFPGVQDGWYLGTGDARRIGVRAGARAGRVIVTAAAGWAWLGALGLLPSPCVDLGIAYTWCWMASTPRVVKRTRRARASLGSGMTSTMPWSAISATSLETACLVTPTRSASTVMRMPSKVMWGRRLAMAPRKTGWPASALTQRDEAPGVRLGRVVGAARA